MNGKIARIEDLLAAGWDVEDIRSDDARIEVLLARGTARTAVLLDRHDAYDLLHGDALLPAPPRPARDALVVNH